MSYSVFPTHRFEIELKRLAKKYPSIKGEFAQLVAAISTKPQTGVSIGNNCYKIRLAIGSKGRGKSGGARVITYVFIDTKAVYLLTVYDKGEKADLGPNELKEMLKTLEF